MITALTIGLGIDYSIHVWRKFEANRESGMGTQASMRDMYATTGSSLIMSAGTTICGFMVLVLSSVPVIKDFGLVGSISVAFSLILACQFSLDSRRRSSKVKSRLMNVHSAAFSIADDTLSISKPCSLATSARAIQRVTGPNALPFVVHV